MKKVIGIVLIVLLIGIVVVLYTNHRGREGLRFVDAMGAGINIGNSLDVTRIRDRKENADIGYYETYWNNPPITKELFSIIKEGGFGTVRIPVSWDEHMNQDNRVDEKWMSRVEEVVGYGLEAGLYVILDTHHESWLTPLPEQEEKVREKLCTLWEQIANRFAEYPKELLFEGMNEPRTVDSEKEWSGGTDKERKVINRLNNAFIQTVRKTGGNNSKRWLIITSYGGNYTETAIKDLKIPKDKNIIVAIHAYIPYNFTLNEEGTSKWSLENKKDTEPIDQLMKSLNENFIKKGIPVIITEFGTVNKNNLKERISWTEYYTETAKKNKISHIWWDNGGKYKLINRENHSWEEPELVQILTK